MIPLRKYYLIYLLVLVGYNAVSQNKKPSLNIIGEWKCIKYDYRGIEKFTFKQAEQIRISTLFIGKNNYYFGKAPFIESCEFYKFTLAPWEDAGHNIEEITMFSKDGYSYRKTRLTEKQLKNLYLLNAVDRDGKKVCYNDCVFYIKGHMLITNCGGYFFYWVKKDKHYTKK